MAYEIIECIICGRPIKKRINIKYCRTCADKRASVTIDKEDYPEYYKVKKLKRDIEEVMKEREKLEKTIYYLIHPRRRPHKCKDFTSKELWSDKDDKIMTYLFPNGFDPGNPMNVLSMED